MTDDAKPQPDVRALAEDVPDVRALALAAIIQAVHDADEMFTAYEYELAVPAIEEAILKAALADRATRETAKAEGRRQGLEEAVEHIDYVRANIVVSFKDRSRFTERDMNRAFRDALTVARDRITGEDEGLWLTPEEAAIRALAKAEGKDG